MDQNAAQLTFVAPLQPAGSRLADLWRPALQRCGGASPLALSHVEGLGLLIQNPADGPAPSGASGSAAHVTFKLSPQPAGSGLPRRSLAGLREESTAEGLVPLSPSVVLESTRTNLPGPPRATKASAAVSPKGVKASLLRPPKTISFGALSNRNTRRLLWQEPARQLFSGPSRRCSSGSLPCRSLAGETLLEATKTSLLGPVLIATRTRDVTSQLSQNQYDPNS
jgi:hypothetical protein